jgi:hypothetical protein
MRFRLGGVPALYSFPVLIHATVTISGDPAMLIACEARLRRLLANPFLKSEVTEHHGAAGLCYDLKVEGGIPFPDFAQASHEFPDLTFDVQWVNVELGEKGGATLVNGRMTAREAEPVAVRTGDEHPAHVEVGPDGRLRLALILVRAGRDEWRGYAVTATRDALVQASRESDTGAVVLAATDGSPEWALLWRGHRGAAATAFEQPPAPRAIEDGVFRELEAVAQRFAREWIWLASGPREEIAVETERYRLYGYGVAPANVRSTRLHRMRSGAEEGAALVHSTLGPDDLWVKDLVLKTWAAGD